MLHTFFSEDSSISMMRILSFISTIAGIAIAFVGMIMGRDLIGLSALAGVFVGSAFAGKVVQKISEIKETINGKP